MLEQQGRLPTQNLQRVSHYQVDEYVTIGRKRIKPGNKTWMDVGLDFTPLERSNVKLADRLLEFEEKNDIGIYVYTWEETTGMVPLSAGLACVGHQRNSTSLNASSCSIRITSYGLRIIRH